MEVIINIKIGGKKMKKSISRILTLAIVASMAVGVVGCKSKTNPTSKDNPSTDVLSKKETLKLDVFSSTANYAGPQIGWFGKYIKDKFNIEFNIIAPNLQGGDSKFATQMASGNLGDIVILGYDNKYQNAVKAKLLLDLSKDDLLNKYGKDIVKDYSKTLEKNKDQNKAFGLEADKIYGIGNSVSTMPATTPSEGATMTWGPDLRWDLYTKLGKPVINTMEDYLPILKKMQEMEPKSDSGKPTYAFSMWADWDGNLMMNAKQFACMQGYDELGFLLISGNEEKYQDFLDPAGFYLRTLKLYYNANKMGLVDPDSISQKFDNANAKMLDGQVLFSWFPWQDNAYNTTARTSQGKGFAMVPFKEEKMQSYGFAGYGDKMLVGIGSKAKSPERIMEFINWLYTPEGTMVLNYGPEGLGWELKNGKPYLTEYGKKNVPNNGTETIPEKFGTGSWKDGVNAFNITGSTVNVNSINPTFNEPYNYQLWQSTLNENVSKLDKDWREAMGAITQKDYLVKNKMLAVSPVTLFAPATPDNATQQKLDQIKAIIKQNSWKMIFAKNDAEYDALLNEMTTKAKGLGYDEVNKFYIEQAKKTFEARKAVK
jgi:putative aldouronate transport system substrate-binding protein